MTGRVHDLLLAAARARPDALAILENGTRLVTWADLAEHAACAADHLHDAGYAVLEITSGYGRIKPKLFNNASRV